MKLVIKAGKLKCGLSASKFQKAFPAVEMSIIVR